MPRVTLADRRILVDGHPHLLLSGEVHYFRLSPVDWEDRLVRLRAAGADTVATYVPWLWHELADRTYDLEGRTHPQRDVAGFLDLAHRLGLHAVVRPGPFVMAELKNEGIPYRVYDDAPDLLPVTWDGAPVSTRTIDYLAPAFTAAVREWYAAVMPVFAASLADRGGPVVAVQLDNEIGMLSWISNSPDLTDVVCADLAAWAEARYGAAGALARFGAAPDDRPAFAAAVRTPAEERSLAVHHDLGTYTRDRYRRYVAFLRATAEKHGVTGVPFVVNIHGTDAGRGRTYPIGVSQLIQTWRDQPQMTSGSDHYLGDLTVENVPDLYVANAFTAAALGPDQPLTSMEFEAGSGDYGEDLSRLLPPEALDLKVRLCVAQGNRLLNLYLFTGGHNPPLDTPVGDGNDRIAFTGRRHGSAAPIGPEGQENTSYAAATRAFAAVRAAGALLADGDEENDGLALGFVPDHYLTEYRHPASVVRAAQVADLERVRGMGPRDVLVRALLLGGFSFPAVDLSSPSASLPPVVALASPATLSAAVQERLAGYVRDGGRLLLHGVVPDRDHDGPPCTVLAAALGVHAGGPVVESSPHYFPSVEGPSYPEVRVGYLQPLSGGEPLLTEVGTGRPVAVTTSGGSLVVGCDYPCHLAFWRSVLASLGVRPRFTHDGAPGVIVTSTVDRAGQRLLHLLNVAPTPTSFGLALRGRPLLGGRRLRLGARAGLMLPYGVRVGGAATLVETTGELADLADGGVTLRPTQPDGDVAVLETARPVTASTGTVTAGGGRATVAFTGPDPVRVTIG
jgi:beta-galactosidase